MRRRFGVGVVVLAGLLLGCGGDAADRRTPRGALGATRGEIAAAASRTVAAGTGSYEITIAANGAGTDVSVRASGAFDAGRHLYSLSTQTSLVVGGLAGTLEVIATPDRVYLHTPQLARRLGAATEWISVRNPGDRLFGLQLIDPAGVLDLLEAGGATTESAPVDVLIGDDGLVRRVTMRFDAAAGNESTESAFFSVQYSDLGAPVAIEPPSADLVTDETGVLEPLLGAKTGG